MRGIAQTKTMDWPWLQATGSAAHPITHGGPLRVGLVCRCSHCGLTAVCGAERDFYTTTDPIGPLYCESCMWGQAAEMVTQADAGLVKPQTSPADN